MLLKFVGPIHVGLRAIMYLYFFFYTTMSECMIFFYGPTVPEINYSSSSSTTMKTSLFHSINITGLKFPRHTCSLYPVLHNIYDRR